MASQEIYNQLGSCVLSSRGFQGKQLCSKSHGGTWHRWLVGLVDKVGPDLASP